MIAMGCRSVRDFARRTGKDWSVVARHIRILDLPDTILSVLNGRQTPELLKRFPLKRLDALTRLPPKRAAEVFEQAVASATGEG